MNIQICSRCKIKKPYSKFPKDKSRLLGIFHYCVDCSKIIHHLNYLKHKKIKSIRYKNHIKKYPWFNSFKSAKSRCKNKNDKNYKTYGARGINFLMKFEDFEFLWNRDKAYLMKQPTIDRINNDGNYELNNCRFLERSENSSKDQGRSIIQYSLNGIFIKEWNTIISASKKLKIPLSTIKHNLYNESQSAHNFIWKYKE